MPETLAAAILLTNLAIVYMAWRVFRRGWMRMIGTFLGVSTAAVYVYVLGASFGLLAWFDPVWFGRAIVRPITLLGSAYTLALLVGLCATIEGCRICNK